MKVKSPFANTSTAYMPSFDTFVRYDSGDRSPDGRTTLRVAILETSSTDPLCDVDTRSDVRSITLFVCKEGSYAWPYSNPPKVGDKFTLACGAEFAVTGVDSIDFDFYTLEARQT